MDKDIKKKLIYLCIVIIIILIFRFLYTLFTNKYNKIEKFVVNTGNAVDLLSKTKSNAILTNSSTIFSEPINDFNNIIKPWTTKIYNMQLQSKQSKAIALYNPKLFINNTQYCKLGDILCTNQDYSPPNSNQLMLLIQQNTSDIKPPISYNLIVNFGEEYVNSKYYEYESYIDNINKINFIKPNLTYLSKVFTTMNSVILNNTKILESNLSNCVINDTNLPVININARNIYIKDFKTMINLNINSTVKPVIVIGNNGVVNCATYCAGNEGKSWNNELPSTWKGAMCVGTNDPLGCYSTNLEERNGLTCDCQQNDSTPYNLEPKEPPYNAKQDINVAKSTIIIPAGVNGVFTTNNNNVISFSLPSTIDSLQTSDVQKILNKIPTSPFIGLTTENISVNTYSYNIFNLIPIVNIVSFISDVCNNINTIYQTEKTNTAFLTYLNMVSDISIIINILDSIDKFNNFIKSSSYTNVNIITIYSNPELETLFTEIMANVLSTETSIIGTIFNILQTMQITYKLSTLTFNTDNINITNSTNTSTTTPALTPALTPAKFDNISNNNSDNIIEGFGCSNSPFDKECWKDPTKVGRSPLNKDSYTSGGGGNSGGGPKPTPKPTPAPTNFNYINTMAVSSFQNNFLSNIPVNNYDVNYQNSTTIKPLIANIVGFCSLQTNLNNNSIINLPLKIYQPVAPAGYVSLGHVFCNLQSQLSELKSNDSVGRGVCCVPENCVKEMRDWNASDKVFEYNKNNTYWALYFNPYIGTFISTNIKQLPLGKVSKVVACVKKCTAVDDLKKADKCARNYYNINKSIKNEVNVGTDLVSDQEEIFYLEKLKAQSDSITRLSKKAQNMQVTIDKATIVNREMNKNKLQSYVDKQKVNIDLILQKLIKDKNSIETNINIPISILDEILNMIKNASLPLSTQDRNNLIDNLLNNNQVTCPGYDLKGLVKKSLVSDVCYGCDSP